MGTGTPYAHCCNKNSQKSLKLTSSSKTNSKLKVQGRTYFLIFNWRETVKSNTKRKERNKNICKISLQFNGLRRILFNFLTIFSRQTNGGQSTRLDKQINTRTQFLWMRFCQQKSSIAPC